MEITLEKIELVKDRTGVTYAEAKAALEEADGSVVDAIIAIEERFNAGSGRSGLSGKGETLFESIKELIRKGNVSRIQVKRDEEIILNVPVNAGIIGAMIAPLASVVGIVAAFGFRCTVEVVRNDGSVIDVSDAVSDAVETVVEKSGEVVDEVKEKSSQIYQKGREKAEEAVSKMRKEPEEFDFSECFEEDEDDVEIDITEENDAAAEDAVTEEDAAEEKADGISVEENK